MQFYARMNLFMQEKVTRHRLLKENLSHEERKVLELKLYQLKLYANAGQNSGNTNDADHGFGRTSCWIN